MEHGLDAFCAEILDSYRDALSSPLNFPDKDWKIIFQLKIKGLADSGLSNRLMEAKPGICATLDRKTCHDTVNI